jgi:hypothetical protein
MSDPEVGKEAEVGYHPDQRDHSSHIQDSLNAKTVGDLYAGNIEARGVEHYLDKAFNLGRKLAAV